MQKLDLKTVRALKNFRKAAVRLNMAWQDGNPDHLARLYPFEDSFELVAGSIGSWVGESLKEREALEEMVNDLFSSHPYSYSSEDLVETVNKYTGVDISEHANDPELDVCDHLTDEQLIQLRDQLAENLRLVLTGSRLEDLEDKIESWKSEG